MRHDDDTGRSHTAYCWLSIYFDSLYIMVYNNTTLQNNGILLVTPCLLMRIREFIHTQHRNTTCGRRPSVVLWCKGWINSRKQTRGNKFIPCWNSICHILKRFLSFKIPAIPLIWPKSPYKHSVTQSHRSGKESRRWSESQLWCHQCRSFVFISHTDDVKREIRLYISLLLTNQKRESAPSLG